MTIQHVLSAVLSYPEQSLIDGLPDIDWTLAEWPQARYMLAPLTAMLRNQPLIALQENYVATFETEAAHSLHLFEHVHSENHDRGQARMDLLKKYRGDDFEPAGNELPDHVPLFLEFLGALIVDGQEERAEQLLGEAIDVLAAIGYRLERNASPYAAAFTVMRTLTDTQPEPQRDPAVRDIDEGGKRSAPTPAVSSHC